MSREEIELRRESVEGRWRKPFSAILMNGNRCCFFRVRLRLVKPQLPANFQEDTWRKLKNAVEAIQQDRPVAEGLEDLYKACENLCSYKMGQFLYTHLRDLCETHVQQELSSLSR
jgi:hypothetical protein